MAGLVVPPYGVIEGYSKYPVTTLTQWILHFCLDSPLDPNLDPCLLWLLLLSSFYPFFPVLFQSCLPADIIFLCHASLVPI